MSIAVGQRVKASGKIGTVRFIGITKFAAGEWFGVELDEPEGKNDGTTNGITYFPCKPEHGVFVRKIQVEFKHLYIESTFVLIVSFPLEK